MFDIFEPKVRNPVERLFKVDIKGSILIELSGVLHTSPNYLLGMEDYEEDLLEIITVYKNLKGSKTKQIALEQMKLLATMSSEL